MDSDENQEQTTLFHARWDPNQTTLPEVGGQ